MKPAIRFSTALLLASALFLAGTSAAHAQFPRTVLLEEFTSLTCKPCTTATPIINNLVKDHAGRVLSMRYHANLPYSGDPYYEAIKEQINARKDYYGVSALPFGRFDGGTDVTVTVEGEVRDKADARLATEAPITMHVTQTREGAQVSVEVKVTAGEAGFSGGDYKLRVVAVEALIHDTRFVGDPKYNGETELFDVVRGFVNSSEGAVVSLNPGEEKTFTYTYTLGSGWNGEQLYTVAFVQNDNDKEIAQAGSSPKPTPGAVECADSSVTLERLIVPVPNPATGNVLIRFAASAHDRVRVELYDLTGRRVSEQIENTPDVGWYQANVGIADLPAGSYTCVVRGDTFTRACRLAVTR